jgi:hypothetical protein
MLKPSVAPMQQDSEGARRPAELRPVRRDIGAIACGVSGMLMLDNGGGVESWMAPFGQKVAAPRGLGTIVDIARGAHHNLAVTKDGTVACWGRNTEGQCDAPAGLGGVMRVAGGALHSVAMLRDGGVRTWGCNRHGQCDVPAELGAVDAIAAGAQHTVALTRRGAVACWGGNGRGQCAVPDDLARGARGAVADIAAGAYHTIVRLHAPHAVSRSSGDLGPIGFGAPRAHTFTRLPAPDGDATIVVRVRGDLRRNYESLQLRANGVVLAPRLFTRLAHDCPNTPDVARVTLPRAAFESLLASSDGALSLALETTRQTDVDECSKGLCEIHLRYEATPADRNRNGVSDHCEVVVDDAERDAAAAESTEGREAPDERTPTDGGRNPG